MRVLVSPDKFKGCLTAAEAADAIARGLRAAGATTDIAPLADGGEGTLDALIAAVGGTVMGVIARGPMGVPVRAHLGRLDDGIGVVEMSQASGLRLVSETDRDPMKATSHGTGELIKGALARRPSRLIVGIGGSATVDGGTGLARALGVRFTDDAGAEVAPGGAGLESIRHIDLSRFDERFSATPVIVAADVMSPLLGPDGAARAFGPQKGATPVHIEALERGLANLAEVIAQDLGVFVADTPGAGAAGGAGAMLLALGAELRSGASVVLEAMDFDRRLSQADLLVTGEGCLDETTSAGKGPIVVARAATAAGIPCIALVGVATAAPPEFSEIRSLVDYFGGDQTESRARAAAGLQGLAARLGSDRR